MAGASSDRAPNGLRAKNHEFRFGLPAISRIVFRKVSLSLKGW